MSTAVKEKKQLFTPSALEKLQSPEQLDQLMRVTSSAGWLGLTAIGIVLLTAILWSILGTIPTRIEGNGILVKSGGISLAVSQGIGQVQEIYVHVGDQVRENELLARIRVPALEQQVKNAEERLAEIEKETSFRSEVTNEDLDLQQKLLAGRRKTLESQRNAAEERVDFLRKKLTNQRELLADGLITEQQWFATEQELKAAESALKANNDELNQIILKESEAVNSARGGTLSQRMRLEEARRTLEELRQDLLLRSEVRSTKPGRVIEVTADVGALVSAGQPIVSIERRGTSLEAVVYVSSTDGKKVRPGMTIHLSPSTVKKEEHGMIVGTVERVSEYPSTSTGMMALLENQQLVQMFSQDGPPIAVYAELDIDHYSFSGYRWTSGLGPPVSISGGTVVAGLVTTEERAPIRLLIPYVRSKLGF